MLEMTGLVLVWMLDGWPLPRHLRPVRTPQPVCPGHTLEEGQRHALIDPSPRRSRRHRDCGGVGATVAFAHIDPDPKEAPAGSEQNVGFTVEHGCEGSPTIQLDMRLPDGVTNAAPEPPDGWTGSVTDDIVTFIGGPLPDDVEATFRVHMILPSTPETTTSPVEDLDRMAVRPRGPPPRRPRLPPRPSPRRSASPRGLRQTQSAWMAYFPPGSHSEYFWAAHASASAP